MRDLEIRGAGNLLGDEQSGHVAALGFELYMQMLDEAVRAAGRPTERRGRAPSRCASTSTSTPTCPADYIPYEQAKIDVHRRIAAALEVADVEALREELEDRFGPVPEPLENLLALQRARIKFGQAGARTVRSRATAWPSCRSSSTRPRQQRLREELPDALYEPGRAQVSMQAFREEPGERSPAVVRAADGAARSGPRRGLRTCRGWWRAQRASP